MILRRAILASLVMACAFLAFGCATPGVMCDMKVDYPSESAVPLVGNVRLAWRFEAEQRGGAYGNTDCMASDDGRLCVVKLKGPPPSFSDVCGLAKLGHEMRHALELTASAGHN